MNIPKYHTMYKKTSSNPTQQSLFCYIYQVYDSTMFVLVVFIFIPWTNNNNSC